MTFCQFTSRSFDASRLESWQFHFTFLPRYPSFQSNTKKFLSFQMDFSCSHALRSSVPSRPAPGPISAIWVSFRGTDDPNCYAASASASHFKSPFESHFCAGPGPNGDRRGTSFEPDFNFLVLTASILIVIMRSPCHEEKD